MPNSKRRENLSPKNSATFSSPESGMTPKCQTVYIRTFGCQMNVRDSEIILGMLQKEGYLETESPKEADVVIFNTCSVRKHAEERAISNMGMLLKARGKKEKIFGIVGCTAQALKKDLFSRLPGLNIVCGPANIYDIPDLIKKAIKKDTQVLAVDRVKRPLLRDCSFRTDNLKAYVSIMYGCNNFCSYCIVPYVRGRQLSRPLRHIIDEVKDLASRGCREITLLGQNVNSYGQDLKGKTDFTGLLEKLNRVAGIERIRFMTSHPKDASKRLFSAMRDLSKLCKHLHLPLQSGSDKILKLMNRGYSFSDYSGLIECLRKIIPGCNITTDIIVGFPQESEADFQKTYQAMQKIRFDQAFIFKYSPRPKTKAAELEDDVPLKVKQKRNNMLLKLQKITSAVLVMLCVLFLFSGNAFAANKVFRNAEALILKDSYSQAAKECERIIARNPRAKVKAKAYYLLGICLLKEGKFDQAKKNLNQLLRRYPGSKFCQQAKAALSRSSFSVQVGCFAKEANARRLRGELINLGFQAYISKLRGEDLYRVRVGKFAGRQDARSLEQRLKTRGYPTKICQ